MESFYAHIIEKGFFLFAIDTVDGVKVQVQINVMNTAPTEANPSGKIVDLSIIKNTLELYEDRAMPENYQGFQMLMERLSELKYDNKYGSIYYINKNKHYEECYKFDNLTLKYNECCVCMEMTRTKTMCSHSLCWICFDKLKNKKCPLCREYLMCEESDDE
jgi:hypothetical protein